MERVRALKRAWGLARTDSWTDTYPALVIAGVVILPLLAEYVRWRPTWMRAMLGGE